MRDACTFLFVPGDRPDRFDKARRSGADVVIVDLEDAVAPNAKAKARAATVEALHGGAIIAVRVSAPGTIDHEADLAVLEGAPRPAAVIVAKSESADALSRVSALGTPVIPLVESAIGLARAPELAAAPGVTRLAFGALDFALDLDAELEPALLDYARVQLVLCSRGAGIAGPLDSPTTEFSRPEVSGRDARRARRLGMTGKLCIHPSQIAAVAAAFRPTQEQIDHARRIIAAAGSAGAAAESGTMVDRPILEKARLTLARAEAES